MALKASVAVVWAGATSWLLLAPGKKRLRDRGQQGVLSAEDTVDPLSEFVRNSGRQNPRL